MSSVVSVDWFDKGRRVAVASASSVLGSGDSQHMAERIEASSGLPQGGHSADATQRTDELKWKQPLATASKTLWLLLLFAMIPSVAALNCSIDLGLIGDGEYETAQCDAGCDSCNFSLANGYFEHSTIECLPLVPCFVFANTGAILDYTTVNGSLASAMTVYTNNAGNSPWHYAIFHAPANRGDFRFEARNSQFVLYLTTIHAVNTGVVDFVIHSDGVNDPGFPELYSVSVYASTANELNIWLGEDTYYALYYDSVIQCPNEGKCKWESYGQRYETKVNDMSVVNVSTHPSTDLQLICCNSLACAGIHVDCDDNSTDTCEMQFASDWQCVGSLNSGQCFANVLTPTTTLKPTTTALVTTTTTTATPTSTKSDSASSGFLMCGLVFGVLALLF